MTNAAIAAAHDVVVGGDAADLLALTAALVTIPSVHPNETAVADAIHARLSTRASDLTIDRMGNAIVARTTFDAPRRIVLCGHLDTVAGGTGRGTERHEPSVARRDQDTLVGLGTADMKGGIAVLLALAERAGTGPNAATTGLDYTFVFYDGEEVADAHNGLRRVFAERPELVAGDLAVLLEPTGGNVEAGCQGTIHISARFVGGRAHTARPWTGDNAIHRMAPVLERLATATPSPIDIDGLTFRQAMQVVRVEGGIANNVVPDHGALVVNRRFAPSLSIDDARREVEELLGAAAVVEVLEASAGALPNLTNPLVAEFIAAIGATVEPKLGWTDVARFAAHGIPALNYGPGLAEVAHTADEYVTRSALEACMQRLTSFLHLTG